MSEIDTKLKKWFEIPYDFEQTKLQHHHQKMEVLRLEIKSLNKMVRIKKKRLIEIAEQGP
jgi:hypothetical protein